MRRTDRPVVGVILGPTGVGKTALAVALAPRLGAEVLSFDSRQIYRGMDIGTAKATPEERVRAPHHLIDLTDPDRPLTLAQFLDHAHAALRDVLARGRFPLIVGGTGQYLAAFLEGWQIPRVPPQPELRARLQAEAAAKGVEALYARLREVDPEAARRIQPRNLRRIVRALEVYEATGQPISRLQGRVPPPYRFRIVGLTLPRKVLYARTDARWERMLERGLLEEVRRLVAKGYGWDLPAMTGLGYLQFRGVIEGRESLEEGLARLRRDTRRFIRHQYTWFRRLERRFPILWLDARRPLGELVEAAEGYLRSD